MSEKLAPDKRHGFIHNGKAYNFMAPDKLETDFDRNKEFCLRGFHLIRSLVGPVFPLFPCPELETCVVKCFLFLFSQA